MRFSKVCNFCKGTAISISSFPLCNLLLLPFHLGCFEFFSLASMSHLILLLWSTDRHRANATSAPYPTFYPGHSHFRRGHGIWCAISRAVPLCTFAYLSAAELRVAISSLETKDVEKASKIRLDQRDKETKSLSRLLPLLLRLLGLVLFRLRYYRANVLQCSIWSLFMKHQTDRPLRKLVCAEPSIPCYSMSIQSQQSADPLDALSTSRQSARTHMGRCDWSKRDIRW